MYAIIEDSGTQIRVGKGDVIRIDPRTGAGLEKQPEKITFDRVLLVGGDEARIGSPYVEGASVEAELLSEEAGDKIFIYKFKRRKNYRRKNGHRQPYLRVRVTDIKA